MNVIKTLDEKSINQIAAGEVIERPSSVVKELVENSLDAGSTDIDIWLEEGGRSLIQIGDNGHGIRPDDMDLCFRRYTTSKISSAEDIFYISTNGFRGEALSSIASVSQMKIESRWAESEHARSITIEGLEIVRDEEVAREKGTTISIRNLFYNTPVRLKFLSSVSAEKTRVLGMLTRLALVNTHCRFRLFSDGKEIFTSVQTDPLQRMGEILGKSWSTNSIPIKFQKEEWVLEGYIGDESLSKSRRQHQYFYLEDRPVQNILLAKALDKAFQQFYPGRLPVCVINFHLPPETFDVNVHPTKKEVRFHNESDIFSFIYQACHQGLRAVLNKEELSLPSHFEAKKSTSNNPLDRLEELVFTEAPPEISEPQDLFSQPELNKTVAFSPQEPNKTIDIIEEKVQIPFLQVNKQYLMVETQNKLLIIDQYQAHFRVLFEEYRERLDDEKFIPAQQLMFPEILEFSAELASKLETQVDRLFKLGFDLAPFGGNSFKLSGLPQDLDPERGREILTDFTNQIGDVEQKDLIETFIKGIASTRAIKKGTVLNQEEMNNLFEQLFSCQNPYVAPNGKPTLNQMPLEDIDKKFK